MRRTSFALVGELVGVAAGLVMLFVTLVWRDWIELVFGADPDGGSGSLEWALVAAAIAVAVTAAILARLEWLRLKAVTS
jgi:hypothetical protein